MKPSSDMMFLVNRTGDPYNRYGWDVHEYEGSFEEPTSVIFHGDISPVCGLRRTKYLLRRLYPGCRIRVFNCWSRKN